ncbi:MAG: ATP-binding protein, partial [Chryseobacterium sp.]
MADNLVGYSRAGDTFHYRWAARRSLKLIYPNSELFQIVVEGSADKNKAGEYVIDLTEYYGVEAAPTKIIFYQLKHTTTQKNKPFLISGLKETFVGFSEKFIERHRKNQIKKSGILFAIVTNRPLDQKLKDNLQDIAQGTCLDKRFLNTISRYTKLKPAELKVFCSILQIEDSHSGYDLQQKELRIEISQLMAGSVDNNQIRSLTSAISEKVLPNSDGLLRKEDVLSSFGIYSDRELYPAEPIWDPAGPVIKRWQHESLTEQIFATKHPLIVHAPGGIGKSVFARQLMDNIKEGSIAIAYDCFGAGKYRNRSQSRHRHKDALVQIANELASKGLCDPMIVLKSDDETSITLTFLKRVRSAITAIRRAYPDAILLILVDAADNAEMAAKDMNDNCFAGELLNEKIPDGCKLVYLCRPERIYMLQPSANIVELALEPFSKEESEENLRLHFPKATNADAEEFHRLTSANPRVQANALDSGASTIEKLLAGLGPFVITVDAQIHQQLENALEKLRDSLPKGFQGQVDKICLGLATLSPNIPLDILAKVAGVDVTTVKSFISDIGRALWQADESVQFRDEPTETWFREKFLASKIDFENYILELEPLASYSSYTAQVLPQLYLQAEQYHKLIGIALSDSFLPKDNPIDARNIRVFRLQFALKAALRINQLKDACMLALRAGEEVAGNDRQITLLKENVDLLVRLQDKEKVQSMAMRRELRGNWEGSENVFSASLLSSIKAYQGEARGFLRSAENWLNIYFKTPKQREPHEHENLRGKDLLEIAYAKLNLNGVDDCMKFLTRLSPKPLIAKIFGSFIRRLIDLDDKEKITALLHKCKKEPLFVIQLNAELLNVGRFCEKAFIEDIFIKLDKGKLRIEKNAQHLGDKPKESTLALAETAVYHGIAAGQLIAYANKYLLLKPDQLLTSPGFTLERDYFLRSTALLAYIEGAKDVDISLLVPLKTGKKPDYDEQRKIDDAREVIGGLLPWYIARIELIANGGSIDKARIEELASKSKMVISRRYRVQDPVPETLRIVYLDILKFASSCDEYFIRSFFDQYIKGNKHISTNQWVSTVRCSHRLEHLAGLREQLEQDTYDRIKSSTNSGPDSLSDSYVSLSRAVINISADNAAVYFDDAVEIVSKFGEEMLRRWDAMVPLAKRAADLSENQPELSYRFSRISELIGQDTREKHWHREGALQISTRLSPTDGIAALSRWREREIGDFGQMIYCLLIELVNSAGLQPITAWSFTEFCPADDVQYALRMFIKSPTISIEDKQVIVEAALHRIERESISAQFCWELQELLELLGLISPKLAKILSQFSDGPKEKQKEPDSYNEDFMPKIDWDLVFQEENILTPEGITASYKKLKAIATDAKIHLGPYVYWKALITKLNSSEAVRFLESLFQCSWVEVYDLSTFFEKLPKNWTDRVAFQRNLQSIIETIGIRYSLELTSDYTFTHMIKA